MFTRCRQITQTECTLKSFKLKNWRSIGIMTCLKIWVMQLCGGNVFFSITGNSMLRVRIGSSVNLICAVQFYLISVPMLLASGTFQREIGKGTGFSQPTMSWINSYFHSCHSHCNTLHFWNQQQNDKVSCHCRVSII